MSTKFIELRDKLKAVGDEARAEGLVLVYNLARYGEDGTNFSTRIAMPDGCEATTDHAALDAVREIMTMTCWSGITH